MNERNVILILVGTRSRSAPAMQQLLTKWGCYIRTRLGLHPGTPDQCTDEGLIFLEMVGEPAKHDELIKELSLLEGIKAKLVSL